ncbi:hypothetical protein MAUB_58970 [Mycolicibacterium aubagnense]|uniref:Major facilitator superfamily (MFS) profile domain-containing protein n=1 Tax=Mycolicibacterium aubagnense TaxID=319707 RepID=A0ABM7IMI2_9MYCO|nr:hypothetical protein MAUB_58970 [Mycolicibacterium aubagnense]
MAAATFLIFFQAFMVAPLIPQLAHEFGSSTDLLGLAVPAYLVPYGAMTLLWGPLSDRIGRKRVILGSAAGFVVLTALTALADGPPHVYRVPAADRARRQRGGADLPGPDR